MRLTSSTASLPVVPSRTASVDSHRELTGLLAACGRGDAQSFRRLHQLSAPRLLRFALRLRTPYEAARSCNL